MKKSRKNLPKIVEMYLRKFCKKKMKIEGLRKTIEDSKELFDRDWRRD